MPESPLAILQRQQIEAVIGELLLTDDHYIRQTILERLRHQIAHADRSLDITNFSEAAREELEENQLLR